MPRRCPSCRVGVPDPRWTCGACGWAATFDQEIACLAPAVAVGDPGFDTTAFARLAEHEARSFWFRARNRLILHVIETRFPSVRTMLEVGCGTGFVLQALSRALPDATLVGSELHLDGLGYARSRLGRRVELQQMDARTMPYDREFDLIGAFDVLEHVEEDEQVLREMYRSCKPGGGILVTVPQHALLWSDADVAAHHKRRYARGDLLAKLRAAGFEPVRTTSFVSLLLPLMMASRLKEWLRRGAYDPDRELSLPGPLDALLERVMDLERSLIRLGLDLPFGGSLLVAARRPQSEKGCSP